MIPVIPSREEATNSEGVGKCNWAMNYIVNDVRREGEAGSRPALGFGFGNFLKVGVN